MDVFRKINGILWKGKIMKTYSKPQLIKYGELQEITKTYNNGACSGGNTAG